MRRPPLLWVPAIAAFATAAQAQEQTQTQSSGVVTVENFVSDGQRNDSFETRISSTLDGVELLFDQTFTRALLDPSVQEGVAAASALRLVAIGGAPAVVRWSGLTLISAEEELIDSFTEMFTRAGPTTTVVTVQVTSGDAGNNGVPVGDRGNCFDSGVSGATNFEPFDGAFANCDGAEEIVVAPGTVNTNTHTSTVNQVDQVSFTNDDYVVREHYQLQGEVSRIGAVHAAAQSGLLDGVFGSATRLSARAGHDRTSATPQLWLAPYGGETRADGDDVQAGSRRRSAGVAGGASFAVGGGWQLGAAVDYSDLDADVEVAPESAQAELTQLAGLAGWSAGGWRVAVLAAYGSGEVGQAHGDDSLGGVSSGQYDVATTGVAALAEYRVRAGSVQLTPLVAVERAEVRSDAFEESGPTALAGPEHTARRTRARAGVGVGAEWHWSAARSLGVELRGVVVQVLSGEENERPVVLASAPAQPLAVRAAPEDETAGELSLGVLLGLHPRVALFAAADARVASASESYGAGLGLRIAW